MGFLKSFFASCLGSLVAMVLLAMFGILIISFIIGSEAKVGVGDNSVLYLDLQSPIVEQAIEDPFTEFVSGEKAAIGLLQLKEALANARDDAKIRGVYLNASYVQAGFSSIEEIRQSLIDFRKSGKWVIAYATNYSEGAYYLATAADQIYLNPEGMVEFNGLSVNVMFFKKLFDKLSIKPQVFRVGEFKSAVEPFTRDNMSEENRLQLTSLIEGIYDEVLSGVSDSRDIPVSKLKEISKMMTVRNAHDAIENKLVDTLAYEDVARLTMKARLGLANDVEIDFVQLSEYMKSFEPKSSTYEIRVIVADGEIMPGRADNGVVGSSTFVREIRKARTNDRVKAIVIRVNSPGGVFQAADEMWHEISLAAKEKPVIASMGDYAASGGYYMAMACRQIVAQPNTITGSIGVFSVLFDLSGFLGDKIGITSDEVKTGEVGGMITVTRPLTPLEKEIWQKQTDEVYETFTQKAAEGRGMSQDEIKKIASGRVWTGAQAKENGLVDVLGGFQEAINLAAEQAGISDDYKVRYYPQPKTFLEKLTGGIDDEIRSQALQKEMGDSYLFYQQWQQVRRYEGVQLRMPLEKVVE